VRGGWGSDPVPRSCVLAAQVSAGAGEGSKEISTLREVGFGNSRQGLCRAVWLLAAG